MAEKRYINQGLLIFVIISQSVYTQNDLNQEYLNTVAQKRRIIQIVHIFPIPVEPHEAVAEVSRIGNV